MKEKKSVLANTAKASHVAEERLKFCFIQVSGHQFQILSHFLLTIFWVQWASKEFTYHTHLYHPRDH